MDRCDPLGKEDWEIRNRRHGKGSRIALCRKGNLIVATCIVSGAMPLVRAHFNRNFRKHRVRPRDLKAIYPTGPIFAFALSRVRPLKKPIKYQHPGGGSWVKLSAKPNTAS